MTYDLGDQVAIVTGGGQGIGRAIARRLAREGAAVVVAARTRSRLEETVGLIVAEGGRARAVPTDITDEEQVRRLMWQTVDAYGRLDILVNNAVEAGEAGPLAEMTLANWRRVMAVDLEGAMLCCREALAVMLPRGNGSIINVSSLAAKQGLPNRSAYGAAKAGLENLTRSLAWEVGRRGVRVNALTVGSVATEHWRENLARRARAAGRPVAELVAEKAARSALGRLVTEDEVAALVAFLASAESSAITGQAINVDAGVEMR